MLISCAVTAQLICAFVYAYAKKQVFSTQPTLKFGTIADSVQVWLAAKYATCISSFFFNYEGVKRI